VFSLVGWFSQWGDWVRRRGDGAGRDRGVVGFV
jgi:hypothetical protein